VLLSVIVAVAVQASAPMILTVDPATLSLADAHIALARLARVWSRPPACSLAPR